MRPYLWQVTDDPLTVGGRAAARRSTGAAVDVKISQVVDAPNMLVSAFLPEDIFVS